MTPDRSIVKQLKSYDKNLFIRWNARFERFELWMKRPMTSASVIITPITQAIYDNRKPPTFCEVDQRLLWWVWAADSHRSGGSKLHAMKGDERFIEMMKNIESKQFGDYYNKAKDAWTHLNSFYATDTKKKNGKPKFNNYKSENRFVRPDVKLRATQRSFARSSNNARAYNYKRAR